MSDENELAHYGVPGMRWGKKKSVYKSMSSQEKEATRSEFKKKVNNRISDARAQMKTGKPKAALNIAKQNRKIAKSTNVGYAKAEKMFQKEKAAYLDTRSTARTMKYGKGTVALLVASGSLTGSFAVPIAAAVMNSHNQQIIGTDKK